MRLRDYSLITLGVTVFFFSLYPTVAKSAILYESTTLGTTGRAPSGSVVGRIDSDRAYYGSIFHIDSGICWEVTAIGGHFCRFYDSSGTLFGAIMKLDSPEVLPSDPPLDFPDVVASTVFVPDYPSSDYRTPLSVTLEAGDYALVFGSDDLGASDGSMVVMNQPGHENLLGEYPIYAYTYQGWNYNYSTGAREARFVVEGTIVPEPATLLLLSLGGLIVRKLKIKK